MNTLDNEKDEYIKNKLKDDVLISKKADDLFNNFLKGEKVVDIENNSIHTKDENVKEIEKDNVIDFAKQKKSQKKKKILGLVASLMVIFVAANGYASTQGYNNIFFIIKNLVTSSVSKIEGKDELLSDRDITISYEMNQIASGVSIQINNLKIKDNKATLTTKFAVNGNTENYPTRISIIDKTNSKELADYEIQTEKTDYANQFTEIIDMKSFKDNTNILDLTIYSGENILAELQINIDEREVDILSSAFEVEKISEIELKSILGDVAKIISIDNDAVSNSYKVYLAINEIQKNVTSNEGCAFEKVQKFINEFDGEKITNAILLDKDIVSYNSKKDTFISNVCWTDTYECINIEGISYEDGIYTVTFSFCPETAGSDIDTSKIYRTTVDFKLNKEYEYIKYCFVNLEDSKMEEVYKEANENDDKNETEVIPEDEELVLWYATGYINEPQENPSYLSVYEINDNLMRFEYHVFWNEENVTGTAYLDSNESAFIYEKENYKIMISLNKTSDNTVSITEYENGKKTKSLDMFRYDIEKFTKNKSDDSSKKDEDSEGNIDVSCDHTYTLVDYTVVDSEASWHTSLDGTHTLKCSKCGEKVTEKHKFGKWFCMEDGNLWTKWCDVCKKYVYTREVPSDVVFEKIDKKISVVSNIKFTVKNYVIEGDRIDFFVYVDESLCTEEQYKIDKMTIENEKTSSTFTLDSSYKQSQNSNSCSLTNYQDGDDEYTITLSNSRNSTKAIYKLNIKTHELKMISTSTVDTSILDGQVTNSVTIH